MTRTGVPRREFLAASIGSASLLLPGRVWAARRRRSSESIASNPGDIAVGFCPGATAVDRSGEIRHTAGPGWVDARGCPVDPGEVRVRPERRRVLDAAALHNGECAFAGRSARVRVHGAYDVGAARPDALAIYAHSRPHHDVAFHAWGVSVDPIWDPSGPTEFRLRVDRTEGLTLSFAIGQSPVSTLTPLEPEFYARHVFARFDLGGARGRPKLRRGLYLVAWSSDATRLPRWSEYEIELGETDAGGPLLSRLVPRQGAASAGFPYVLLSVGGDFVEETSEGGA